MVEEAPVLAPLVLGPDKAVFVPLGTFLRGLSDSGIGSVEIATRRATGEARRTLGAISFERARRVEVADELVRITIEETALEAKLAELRAKRAALGG